MNSPEPEFAETHRTSDIPVERQVKFKLYQSGAFAVSMYDEKSRQGALVEHDGKHALHIIRLHEHTWEETVIKRRATPRGTSISTSRLQGNRHGYLEWEWSVKRPGLVRTERWQVPVGGRPVWTQVDKRPGRTTKYHSLGHGHFRGTVTDHHGKSLWISDWTRDARGGWNGTYTDMAGKVVGTVQMNGGTSHGAAPSASWDGPLSRGFLGAVSAESPSHPSHHGAGLDRIAGSPGGAAGANAQGSVKADVTTDAGGHKTYTWNEGGGHSVGVGSDSNSSWVKITTPGDSAGSSKSVEFGDQKTPQGDTETYTTNRTDNADGSNSWTQVRTNSGTGDKETVFGAKDSDGNFSYSERIEHTDGSVTIIIRTTDKDGNVTEQNIEIAKDGTVTGDVTFEIPAPKGGTGGPGKGTDPGDTGAPGDTPGSEPSSPGEPTDPDPPDPNDPGQPDQPDAPDHGGGSGSGMPSDDGTDDRAPKFPGGHLGSRHSGQMSNIFNSVRDGDYQENDGGDGADAANASNRNGGWQMNLGDAVQNGGGDQSGWGDGDGGPSDGDGRGSPGGGKSPNRPMMHGIFTAPSGDDSGWGEFVNPRAMVGYVLALTNASSVVGRASNLLSAIESETQT